MNPTQADMDAAEALWSSAAFKVRGCTCGGVDIGVGTMHEPACGDPRPEDVAVIVAKAREEGRRAGVAEKVVALRATLAERDEARALLDDVLGVLRWSTERDDIRDPVYEPLVESICNGVGYGALMDSTQRCWRRSAETRGDPPGGEHTAGPCRGTVDGWLRKYDAMPGAKPPKGNGAQGVVVIIDTGSDHE